MSTVRGPAALTADGAGQRRTFRLAALAVAAALVAWSLLIAWREWFYGDDFLFLLAARAPARWLDIWLPLGPRQWWSYRPLSIDVYFRLGLWAFGHSAFGFLVVSLTLHFAGGALVYRIARRLGVEWRAALATALLSLSRTPSLTAGLWVSAFQHVGTTTFLLAAVAFLLDYGATRDWRARAASCAALVLALLCNESAAMAPGVLLPLALSQPTAERGARRLHSALRDLAPHLGILAIYLVVRLGLLGPTTMPDAYTTHLGWNIIANARDTLRFVFDGSPAALIGAVVLAAAAIAAAPPAERPALLRVLGVCAAWTATAMLPYLPLTYADPRYAINIEAPLMLGVGASLSALMASARGRHDRLYEAALLALVCTTIPYRTLWDRTAHPQGAPGRRFVEQVRITQPPVPAGSTLVVIYGLRGLADEAVAFRFRFVIFWGRAFEVDLEDRNLRVKMLGPSETLSDKLRRTHCEFYALRPDLTVEPATPSLIEQTVARGGRARRR